MDVGGRGGIRRPHAEALGRGLRGSSEHSVVIYALVCTGRGGYKSRLDVSLMIKLIKKEHILSSSLDRSSLCVSRAVDDSLGTF